MLELENRLVFPFKKISLEFGLPDAVRELGRRVGGGGGCRGQEGEMKYLVFADLISLTYFFLMKMKTFSCKMDHIKREVLKQ